LKRNRSDRRPTRPALRTALKKLLLLFRRTSAHPTVDMTNALTCLICHRGDRRSRFPRRRTWPRARSARLASARRSKQGTRGHGPSITAGGLPNPKSRKLPRFLKKGADLRVPSQVASGPRQPWTRTIRRVTQPCFFSLLPFASAGANKRALRSDADPSGRKFNASRSPCEKVSDEARQNARSGARQCGRYAVFSFDALVCSRVKRSKRPARSSRHSRGVQVRRGTHLTSAPFPEVETEHWV